MTYSRKLQILASAAPFAIGLALLASPASAQQEDTVGAQSSQDQTVPGQTDEARAAAGQATSTGQGEDVVVTGSRIVSPTITAVAPVQVVSDVQIDQAGVTNVQELLIENPAFTPGLSRTNTAFLTSGAGVATVSLRNLGSDRTLVLINGRRVVAGLPGSATVDLNIIPQQFIQRIDTLTGGASSLYGSDAVAGVVNFIYKDDFEGVDANAQYGITERGDDRRYQANVTVGANSADDRGNIMVHVGYTREDGLLSRQRRNTLVDDLDTAFNLTGDPADYGVPTQPFFSGFAPQGRFTAGGCNFTFGPTGALERGFSANGGTISAGQAAACGVPAGTALPARGFNRQFFRTIAVPVERYLFAARARYDISDSLRFIGEATYNNTSSAREIEPFPLDSGGIGGINPVSGLIPLEQRVGTTLVRNPFVPDAIYNAARDGDGDGLRDFSFARRISEFGTRNGETERNLYRFVVGFEGDLFDNKFNWDLTYNYGRNNESQISNGQVNVLNFRNALNAVPGPNGPQCADPIARAQGCVPINIFGANSISPAAVRYIAADQTLQSRITQQVVQGNLSGVLFDLPAGPLGVAVGAEYRKETSRENNDALTNAGLNAGNAIPDTSGEFDVKELYGEVNVPILADTSFVGQLNLRAAGRVSDYSTVGTVYTYSVGGEWAPIPDIRFSGTYAQSVRAPNIGELFTGPSQTFPSGLQDPCVGVQATGGGTRGDVCRASPGVLANIAANNGTFALTQPDLQGISGFNGGNPNLGEETSKSYTGSVVITPRSIDFLRNVVLRVDYFNIEIEDAINAPPRQFVLDQCYNQNNQELCSFIRRRPTATGNNSAGSIELIDAFLINAGELSTEGLDVTLTNRIPLDGVGLPGAFNMRVAYTHLFNGEVIPVPGSTPDVFAGEVGTPQDRFTATVGYTGERFNINFTGTYFGRSNEDDQTLASLDLDRNAIKIPAQFYLDSQASFKAADQYEFYVGVDNLLDNDAPNILSGTTFNVTGTDTAAATYDVFGRRYYAGVRFRF
ncbi:TonB-dependent receptor domain-containing protein [Sphingomonas lenta]|uniref:TonB-dependent receptor domain-containing protein n=1 Tax=Sphingomonas lenta TaxID=1141887 RepID=UPI001FE2AB9A|nr:TonB-dependent receptor [Sphingomonas lenta]